MHVPLWAVYYVVAAHIIVPIIAALLYLSFGGAPVREPLCFRVDWWLIHWEGKWYACKPRKTKNGSRVWVRWRSGFVETTCKPTRTVRDADYDWKRYHFDDLASAKSAISRRHKYGGYVPDPPVSAMILDVDDLP